MPEDVVRDAEASLEAGRLQEAEALARQALFQDPASVRAKVVLGLVEARTGRGQSATTRFQEIHTKDPSNFEAVFWLSVLYRQAKDHSESIRFAQMAASIRPDEARVYSNLGLSQLAVHDLVRAAANFEKAAKLNPAIAQTFHHLGITRQLQGLDDEAVVAFRRAISVNPSSVDTLFFLGQSLMNQGDSAGAIECAETVLKARPDSATARLLLANALISENRIDEAEAHIKRAMELDPKDGTAHAMLGLRLQGLGRLDEANAAFRRSIDLQPAQGLAYCALIRNRKTTDADADMLKHMEGLATDAALPRRGLSFLHFGLGKAYEDLGQYERAMDHFDQANAISYRLRFGCRAFDRKQYAAMIDWTIDTFSQSFFARHKAAGIDPASPIFILGMMRSGTTLVEQILSNHPDVAARGEQPFWMQRGSEAIIGGRSLDDAKLRRLAGEYVAALRSPAPSARRLTDKMPDNYLALGLIHAALPNAVIVHTRRNPIDTCISIYTTPNRTSDPYANDKDNIVFAYEQYLRLMEHWRRALPPERFVEVDYEALVGDAEPTIQKLLADCGLSWHEGCLHPEQNERAVATPSVWQVRQPVYTTSVARWRRYEPWLGPFARLKEPFAR